MDTGQDVFKALLVSSPREHGCLMSTATISLLLAPGLVFHGHDAPFQSEGLAFFFSLFFSYACVHAHSCLTLCDPMGCSPPVSSVHGISRQEYWSGLAFPAPGDLPDLLY